MSYESVLALEHSRIRAALEPLGVQGFLLEEPASVQVTPLLYSEFDALRSAYGGGLTKTVTYRTLHRIVVSRADAAVSQALLRGYVNALPSALDRDNLRGGDTVVPEAEAVLVKIAGVLFRALDFYSESSEVLRLGEG